MHSSNTPEIQCVIHVSTCIDLRYRIVSIIIVVLTTRKNNAGWNEQHSPRSLLTKPRCIVELGISIEIYIMRILKGIGDVTQWP